MFKLVPRASECSTLIVKIILCRVGGGLKVAMEQLPQAGKRSAKAIKNVARKVVGEENVSKIKQSVDELPEVRKPVPSYVFGFMTHLD